MKIKSSNNYILGLILGTIFSAVAQADVVYKWVDAEGIIHYSQSIPEVDNWEILRTQSINSSTTSSSQEKLAKDKAMLDERRQERQKQAAAKDQSEAEKQKQEAECAQIRETRDKFLRSNQVKQEMDDGSYTTLTEEARQAEIKRFNDYLQEYCQ